MWTAALMSPYLPVLEAVLADVVLRHAGKAYAVAFPRAALKVFEGFHYVREIGAPDGLDHVLVVEATVEGLTLTGCDVLQHDAAGKITDFMALVRLLRDGPHRGSRQSHHTHPVDGRRYGPGSAQRAWCG
ncbi:nuclear transport factor 2 family protein [Streptomyces sp. NPDC005402]|uniref:nuclear transport factor 2 family protein n=1 Tax=Streptomyces sp. NPDC005402 TaxID=3155338 RepID=UPI0033AC54BD